MFGAKSSGAAVYEPGPYFFGRFAEMKDNLPHGRTAALTPLIGGPAGFGF